MNGSTLSFYLRFYQGKWLALLATSSLLVLQPAVLVTILYAIKTQFSETLAREAIGPLVLVSLGLLSLYIISGGLALFIRHRIMAITHEAIQALRHELSMRLYAFSREQYAEFDRKRLQTVLVQDVIRVDVMTNAFAGQLVPAAVIVGTLSLFLLWTSVQLFLVMACLFPLLILLEACLRPVLRRLMQGYHRSLETLQKTTLFGLEALDLTHERGAIAREIEQQVDAGNHFRRISSRLALLREFRMFGQDVLMLAISIVCLLAGSWLIVSGAMSAAELFVFYMAIVVMRPHVQTCWNTLPQIVEGFESLATLDAWQRPAGAAHYNGHLAIDFRGDVVFRRVCFDYPGRKLLRDIDLHLQRREISAVFGPNGAGKSTLAYLLLGFYRPQSGDIIVNGHSLADLALIPFRRQVGVVPQNPFIFQGSILDNITYGVDDPVMEEVETASKLARLDDFARSLEDGYDTLVGENGMTLSGGQRQRVALARALLTRPALLILDEPTNHLDAETVQQLMGELQAADYRPTVLLITHDQALRSFCHKVYLLENGHLAELENPGHARTAENA